MADSYVRLGAGAGASEIPPGFIMARRQLLEHYAAERKTLTGRYNLRVLNIISILDHSQASNPFNVIRLLLDQIGDCIPKRYDYSPQGITANTALNALKYYLSIITCYHPFEQEPIKPYSRLMDTVVETLIEVSNSIDTCRHLYPFVIRVAANGTLRISLMHLKVASELLKLQGNITRDDVYSDIPPQNLLAKYHLLRIPEKYPHLEKYLHSANVRFELFNVFQKCYPDVQSVFAKIVDIFSEDLLLLRKLLEQMTSIANKDPSILNDLIQALDLLANKGVSTLYMFNLANVINESINDTDVQQKNSIDNITDSITSRQGDIYKVIRGIRAQSGGITYLLGKLYLFIKRFGANGIAELNLGEFASREYTKRRLRGAIPSNDQPFEAAEFIMSCINSDNREEVRSLIYDPMGFPIEALRPFGRYITPEQRESYRYGSADIKLNNARKAFLKNILTYDLVSLIVTTEIDHTTLNCAFFLLEYFVDLSKELRQTLAPNQILELMRYMLCDAININELAVSIDKRSHCIVGMRNREVYGSRRYGNPIFKPAFHYPSNSEAKGVFDRNLIAFCRKLVANRCSGCESTESSARTNTLWVSFLRIIIKYMADHPNMMQGRLDYPKKSPYVFNNFEIFKVQVIKIFEQLTNKSSYITSCILLHQHRQSNDRVGPPLTPGIINSIGLFCCANVTNNDQEYVNRFDRSTERQHESPASLQAATLD